MRITLRYHALLRERTGCAAEPADLPDGSNAGAALEYFFARHPALQGLRAAVKLAVNDEFAAADAPLKTGDTVDVLPPFGGG